MVIDTCVFIDFLRKKDKTSSILYSISDVEPLVISSVTLYELLMGATDENKLRDIKILTEDLMVLNFDEQVAKKSAKIYHLLKKENKMIEIRDIFIAATCLVHKMPLKTLNYKHFERIPGLEIL